MLLWLEFWASILRSVDVHWGGEGDFHRRQPQPREMIFVYLRLASGEKMACQILVLICRVKYYGRDLRTKGGGPFEDPGVFAAANCPSEVNRGRGEEEEG